MQKQQLKSMPMSHCQMQHTHTCLIRHV